MVMMGYTLESLNNLLATINREMTNSSDRIDNIPGKPKYRETFKYSTSEFNFIMFTSSLF
jgi:hypothetical protein